MKKKQKHKSKGNVRTVTKQVRILFYTVPLYRINDACLIGLNSDTSYESLNDSFKTLKYTCSNKFRKLTSNISNYFLKDFITDHSDLIRVRSQGLHYYRFR